MDTIGNACLKPHQMLGAKLEIVFRFTPDEGSNPSLSAIILSNTKALGVFAPRAFLHGNLEIGYRVAVATTE